MADSHGDRVADSKREAMFDFDKLSIHVTIDDEVHTGETIHREFVATEQELESADALDNDLVRMYARRAADSVVEAYWDERSDGE